MARHSSGVRTAIGSTTLPICSLYAIAGTRPALREVHLFNTAAVAVALLLRRLTSTGTQGGAQTEAEHDPDGAPPLCTFHTTHTVNPTLGDDLGYRVTLPATIGAGVIWTFGDKGILVPLGTANGIGVLVATGTGQIVDATMVWDE